MKRTINVYEFRDAFRDMGRGDSFSYDGLGLLFDWFEEYEDSAGEEMELDVIAICCDWTESDVEEIMGDYGLTLEDLGLDPDDSPDDDEIQDALLDYLNDRTMVAGATDAGTIVYLAF